MGQLIDLAVQPIKDRVLAGNLLAENVLAQHENGQKEHDREQQRRQRIYKSRPVINTGATTSCPAKSHL